MSKKYDYSEWNEIVGPIITNSEYLRRKEFRHHGDITVYTHSISVSKCAYRISKYLHLNYKDAAIAGVLHDFYTTPWQDVVIKQPFFKMHAFTHARVALENSQKYFGEFLNKKIENAILRHMFPLNIVPPKYLVGIIITIADKVVSFKALFNKEVLYKTLFFFRKD